MKCHSLFTLRYDVRNRFDDKAQFGLKSNLPRMITNQEAEFEKLLEEERYYALGRDIMEEELLQGYISECISVCRAQLHTFVSAYAMCMYIRLTIDAWALIRIFI